MSHPTVTTIACESIVNSFSHFLMKGPFVCRVVCLIFKRPGQIVWKPQITKKIDHFDVRFYGKGIRGLSLICKRCLKKGKIAALRIDFKPGLALCLLVPSGAAKSIDDWLAHMIQPIIYFFEVAKLSVALSLSKLGVNVGELSNVWAFHAAIWL